jgi:hypothetical protein
LVHVLIWPHLMVRKQIGDGERWLYFSFRNKLMLLILHAPESRVIHTRIVS